MNKLHSEITFIFNNELMILLVTISAIVSIFAVLPAIKGSSEYANRFKVAVVLAVIVGFILGILDSASFILSNRYLQLKMNHLVITSALSIINKYLLIAIGIGVFVFIMLIATRAFLKVIGLNRRASEIIVCGIAPSLLVFALGGYWINKTYLLGFLKLKSIIGNVMWALICVLLLWAIGWIILKVSQVRLNFSPRIYIGKTLIVVIGVIVLFNIVPYFYFLSFKSDRPNLILISVDTLRADHLSCYGYNRNTTPNIDRLAKDGVLFANTIAQSSWTLPSHMSLLTALYPSGHGVIETNYKLSNEHLTLAEVLQNAGYYTVAFTDGYYVSHKFGYQGFNNFEEGFTNPDKGGGIEFIYNKAISWLKKNHSVPFFLFLHTYQPHCPFSPPPAYDIYSDKNYQGIVNVAGKCTEYYDRIKPQMNPKDYQHVIDKYDGEIYYTDHFLGKLFKELKNLGIYNKSVIVFTSDHGENFLDHAGSITHLELYDEIVKVPLIIKTPMFSKNRTIDAQVESIDIMPTVLELLEISIPSKIDGRSLVKLVRKGSYDKIFAFSERVFVFNHKYHEYSMIRNNLWKLLVRSPQNRLELFDLKNDPKEQNNLIAEEAETAKYLHEKLQTWMDTQEGKSKLFSSEKFQLDDELTEKLKALGYMN